MSHPEGEHGRMSAAGQQRFCLREQSGFQNSLLSAQTHTFTHIRCQHQSVVAAAGEEAGVIVCVCTKILEGDVAFVLCMGGGLFSPAAVSKLSALFTAPSYLPSS